MIHITIIKNHIGRLTAQFQCDRNQFICCRLINISPDFCRTGECQFIQIRMIQDPLTGLRTCTGHYIHHSFRQHIGNKTNQFQKRKRCMRRRLNDNRIAGSQSRCQLPTCHKEREIPRNYLTYHAHRFMKNKRQCIVIKHRSSSFLRTNTSGKIPKMIRTHRNIYCACLTNRFPIIQRFNQCQMLSIFINNICYFQKIILSFNG